jgi:phage shock protein E
MIKVLQLFCSKATNKSFLFFQKKEMKRNKSARKTVIDVRRPDEFSKGHAEGSINIPLAEMPDRLDEIKKIKEPIVVVCGGGTRHVKAFELLKANGIETEKGGAWKDVM